MFEQILPVLIEVTAIGFAFVAGNLSSPQGRRAILSRLTSRKQRPVVSDEKVSGIGAGQRA